MTKPDRFVRQIWKLPIECLNPIKITYRVLEKSKNRYRVNCNTCKGNKVENWIKNENIYNKMCFLSL